jgi:hypothetical protein
MEQIQCLKRRKRPKQTLRASQMAPPPTTKKRFASLSQQARCVEPRSFFARFHILRQGKMPRGVHQANRPRHSTVLTASQHVAHLGKTSSTAPQRKGQATLGSAAGSFFHHNQRDVWASIPRATSYLSRCVWACAKDSAKTKASAFLPFGTKFREIFNAFAQLAFKSTLGWVVKHRTFHPDREVVLP